MHLPIDLLPFALEDIVGPLNKNKIIIKYNSNSFNHYNFKLLESYYHNIIIIIIVTSFVHKIRNSVFLRIFVNSLESIIPNINYIKYMYNESNHIINFNTNLIYNAWIVEVVQ